MQMQSTTLKIVLSGEKRTGKASICKRFSENKFEKHMPPTIGIDFVKKMIQYKDNLFRIILWFGNRCERFARPTRSHYRNSKGILFVFTPTLSSIEYIKSENKSKMQYNEIKNNVRYLIESKSDLCEKREVSKEEAIALSKEYGYKYFECSALTGENVHEIVHCIMRDIIERELLSNNDKKYLTNKDRNKKCIIF